MKSALLPFKILIFSVIHHVACLKQFLSFRRDLNFSSHIPFLLLLLRMLRMFPDRFPHTADA